MGKYNNSIGSSKVLASGIKLIILEKKRSSFSWIPIVTSFDFIWRHANYNKVAERSINILNK